MQMHRVFANEEIEFLHGILRFEGKKETLNLCDFCTLVFQINAQKSAV